MADTDSNDAYLEVMLSLKPAQTIEVKAFHRHAYESLPVYARPQTILVTEQFPLTTSGKIDRKQLAQAASARHRDTKDQHY